MITKAQNLVPNNSFESHTSNPAYYGEWYRCTSWSNVNGYQGFLYPYASPDYLTTSGGSGVQLPNTTFGTVNAHTGSAVMGFVAYTTLVADFREYLSVQLSSPMQTGVAYEVSFYWTNGTNCYCGSGCNHVGIDFSTSALSQSTCEPINVTPQIDITSQLWSSSWQNESFTFTPAAPYNYFTIGNFNSDLSTSHTHHNGPVDGAYYFIDDIVVQPAVILPITLTSFTGFHRGETNVLEWVTASEHDNDFFALERMKENDSFEELGKVDAVGTSVSVNSYTFTDDHVIHSTEYYRLRQVNTDGSFTYSNVVAINSFFVNNVKLIADTYTGEYSIDGYTEREQLFSSTLFNIDGEELMRSPQINIQDHFVTPLPLDHYPPGTYVLEIFVGGSRKTFKVIKT